MGLRSLFRRKKKNKRSSLSPSPLYPPHPLPSRSLSSKINDELRLVFQKFDGNGDGNISSSELESILATLDHPATSSELERMIREADTDGDGFVDMEEFVAINTNIDHNEVLRDAFSVFDVDKNGLISADEVVRVMKSLGEECTILECVKMIDGVDRDGDGMIDFEEFKDMMSKGLTHEVA